MILPGTLLHADEQFVVLIHEGFHERTVVNGKQRNQRTEIQVGLLTRGLGDGAAASLAVGAGFADGLALGLDQADGLKDFAGGALDYELLLPVKEREQSTVFLQFGTERLDERLD